MASLGPNELKFRIASFGDENIRNSQELRLHKMRHSDLRYIIITKQNNRL